MAGDAIGSQYLLLHPIGRGATGTVWEGDGPTGRVAIKVLRADLGDDPEVVDRFLRERTILLTLRSPHIVSVHDLVAEGSRLAIVMDLVEGEQLRLTLGREGTIAPKRAIAIVRQVLAGLAAAHAQGVVHRDVKPENILVHTSDGVEHVALVDFGVAWITERAATNSTDIVGTPNYMAPEIADGGAPDDRTDVYATGVVLYELLFGRAPFSGSSVTQVLRAHREGVLERPGGVPDPLWTVIAAMVALDPAARPAAEAAAHELDQLAAEAVPTTRFAPVRLEHADHPTVRGTGADGPPSAPPPSYRRRGRTLAVVLGTLALAVVGGVLAVRSGSNGRTAACVRSRPFTPDAPAYRDDVIIDATDDTGAPHAGKFFDGVWLGFGNSGVSGPAEVSAMRRAGALPPSLPTQSVPFGEYRTLANQPPDGRLYREWSARRHGDPLVYLLSVGGTVVRTDAAGVRHIGEDPRRAVLVPRYAFERFMRIPPTDGTVFRMGDRTYLVRNGERVARTPCVGDRPMRVPRSAAFLRQIPSAT